MTHVTHFRLPLATTIILIIQQQKRFGLFVVQSVLQPRGLEEGHDAE